MAINAKSPILLRGYGAIERTESRLQSKAVDKPKCGMNLRMTATSSNDPTDRSVSHRSCEPNIASDDFQQDTQQNTETDCRSNAAGTELNGTFGSVAAQLHDGVQQRIAFSLFALERLTRNRSAVKADELLPIATEIKRASLDIAMVIDALRSNARLGNAQADRHWVSIGEHLSQLIETWEDLVACEVNFVLDGDVTLPIADADNICCIAQEAVHNALRHGGASRVNITHLITAKKAILVLEDDGCGFEPNAKNNGIGLKSMQNRAQSAGGSLTITSQNQGTRLRLEYPLP